MVAVTGAAVTVNDTGTVTVVAPVALRAMVTLYVLGVSVPVVTVAVIVPFPVPDDGLTVSQAALPLALQLKVPPPVLLMLTVWAEGLAPPCWAVKDRLVGLAPMAGGTGAVVTVKVTGTVTGVAPVALRVMVPVCVPAVSAPVVTLTVTTPLPVPEAGLTVSQGALSLALHVRVPPPVLLRLSVWVAGLLPPCWAVKERLVGLALMAGGTGAAATVKVTGTVIVGAPVAVIVAVPP